ncbi:hypothetical protein GW17_00053394 [Ensete ventricosum]|nr:hypothetical protein GW17_00053394 [Ensete ventricosum]
MWKPETYSSDKSSATTNPPRPLDADPSAIAALPPPLSTEPPDNFSQRALHPLLTAAFSHRATSPHLQPSSTRSATLLPTSLLDLYSQHIPTNRRRSSSTERSGTEVHLPRANRRVLNLLISIAAIKLMLSYSRPAFINQSERIAPDLSFPQRSRSLELFLGVETTSTLNPQAYVGLFPLC